MTSTRTQHRPRPPSTPKRDGVRRVAATSLVIACAVGLVAALSTGTAARLLGLDAAPTVAGGGGPTPAGVPESEAEDAPATPAAGPTVAAPPPLDGEPSSGSGAPDVFDTAALTLTDNDGGTAMFTLSNAAPGAGDTGCITVTYHGGFDSTVRLYGTTTGTGLDSYLHLTLTRGTFPAGVPPFDSCTGFVPDTPDYLGAGAGVIFDDTLDAYPDSYDAGLADPPGAPEPWADSETHAYRFAVTVGDDNAAQGLTAGQTFTWEARGEYPPVPIPVVEPTSGPPGTVVTVASGSDPCTPPAGAVEPRVRVWTSASETGETLAHVTLPVAADGSWEGNVTVPGSAGAFPAVEFQAVCFDAADVTAATEATATAYRTYTAVPFTVMAPGATPGTPPSDAPAAGTPPSDAPAAGTPPSDAPASGTPAPPATPVRAQPTFTG